MAKNMRLGIFSQNSGRKERVSGGPRRLKILELCIFSERILGSGSLRTHELSRMEASEGSNDPFAQISLKKIIRLLTRERSDF
jgi:hypothetical protein